MSSGFIDILADNAANPDFTYQIFEKYKLTDGCTTALQLHGGSADIKNYYDRFANKKHWINYGVSAFVMVIRNRTASLQQRILQTEKCMAEGALAVSHSIEYQPTEYSEVLAYAKIAKKYDRPYFLHLRHSAKETELEGIKEAIKLSQDSGAHIHIDHINSTGGTFNMPVALDLIRKAIEEGSKITTCVYPYSYWATYLPSKRFDEGWQKRYNITYKDLEVVGTGERLTYETFTQYRKGMNRLVAVPENTVPMDKTVDLALKEDFCMIGSDGGIESEPRANNHPRGSGTFSRAIRHAMDIKMPLEKILEKMTTLPQKHFAFAMPNRGLLKTGFIADLTLFDEKTIDAKSTNANPNQFSSGIIKNMNGMPVKAK